MLDRTTLEQRIRLLSPSRDAAPISMLVQRLPGNRRQTPPSVVLDVERGVLGDRWEGSFRRKIEAQVTLMRWDVASVMHPEPAMLGDNLFASIDTSAANLPPGTVVSVGQATCIVTPKAHTGCSKFEARAGRDALELTRDPAWKDQQLRGVHLRILEGGEVRLGDLIEILSRPGE